MGPVLTIIHGFDPVWTLSVVPPEAHVPLYARAVAPLLLVALRFSNHETTKNDGALYRENPRQRPTGVRLWARLQFYPSFLAEILDKTWGVLGKSREEAWCMHSDGVSLRVEFLDEQPRL